MDVSEVHTPYLHVLVSRSRNQQIVVRGNVETKNGEFVPVEIKRQLHRIEVAYLHCLVQQRKYKVLSVVCKLYTHYLVCCFDFLVELKLDLKGFGGLNERPKFYCLVRGGTCNQ